MRHMRKLLALVLAVMMVMSLATSAFAGTVTNSTEHTYDVYQVMTGTQNETDGESEMGDIQWGNGVDGDALLSALKADARFNIGDNGANIFEGCEDAAAVAAVLSTYEDNSDVAKAFANVAADNRTTVYASVEGQTVSPDLPAGYYLFIDDSVVTDEYDASNSALLQLTKKGDVVIAKKYNVPTVDKDITMVEDTVYANGIEAADVNIGDTVEFTLTGTLPENYADYETYAYTFHDTLSAGLTYNNDVKVYVDNNGSLTEVTASFTSTGTLTVTCANLKAITDATIDKDSKIVVKYTATLNAAADIGNPGNPNTVYLEYSNDPNHKGEGTPSTGKTPEDKVIIFTYELDVTKIDGKAEETKLKDAEFVLYREVEVTVDETTSTVKEYVTVDTNGVVTGWTTSKDEASVLKSDENGLFKVAGLDAGTYYLEETKAPAGYNLLDDPIKVIITATVDDSEESPALTALKIEVDGTTTDGNLDTGVVATTVKNNKGVTLPETGGIGTTIFYVLGGVLVLAAVVLLVTKKRMSV